ncbi:MAG: hypothetical protein JXA93_02385 [Anaerolineae bacterium]|nr:hypothetical protein [Anaerolineae bacterium]
MKRLRRPALAGIIAFVLLGTLGLVQQPDVPARGEHVFPLQAPPFLSVAHADEEGILSVIGDEAGIAAYFQSATAPDMDSVRDAFRTIEAETADYILGSVEVLNYPESEDVHVYVHADGWFLAYYLAADPVGKIYDWRAYHNSGRALLTTKLENTLIKVASYAVVTYPGCTYYDFRYPNATHLMLIAEWVISTHDEFEVELPGSFAFDERSWSFGTTDRGGYELDATEIVYVNCDGWCTRQGILTAAQLLPEQFHTFYVWTESGDYAYGGLALIYRVP